MGLNELAARLAASSSFVDVVLCEVFSHAQTSFFWADGSQLGIGSGLIGSSWSGLFRLTG
jgi:hypothetical protein